MLDQHIKARYEHMYSRLSGTGDPAARKAPPGQALGNQIAAQGQGTPLAQAGKPGQSATAISNADAASAQTELTPERRDQLAGDLFAQSLGLA